MKKVKITKDTGIPEFPEGAILVWNGGSEWSIHTEYHVLAHHVHDRWVHFFVREGYAEEVQEEPEWKEHILSIHSVTFEDDSTGHRAYVPRSLYEHIAEDVRKDERQSIHARIRHLTWLATPDAERLSEALRLTGFCKEVHKLQEYLDGNE